MTASWAFLPGQSQLDGNRLLPYQLKDLLHADEPRADRHVYLIENDDIIGAGADHIADFPHTLAGFGDVLPGGEYV